VDYTSAESYTYTPRKPLRRVLDHALDHLNQIDQWERWRREAVVPTPTDGWVPSTVTLPEDRLPLTAADLDAWLWRIDQAMRLLAQRAAALDTDALDWQPPDGGWPLRRVLHHVARSEVLYAAAFDEALPADPVERYAEADARFRHSLAASSASAGDRSIVFPDPYGTFRSPAEVVGRSSRSNARSSPSRSDQRHAVALEAAARPLIARGDAGQTAAGRRSPPALRFTTPRFAAIDCQRDRSSS
jgi:hypothetical protein